MTENYFMRIAIELAQKGCGHVNPNPLVGAVITKDNIIIGQGWHQKYGELHAERNALADCTWPTTGATMYVTLEPCCHHGKTPPCTEAIIESGIKRVVIGSPDPNPLVAGKGIRILKENGIEVVENVLRKECDQLNEVFLHYISTKEPFVVMKYAMTMDGKIASASGKSKWITREMARHRVQIDRNRYAAIMVGTGTVLADDPTLTCRIKDGRNPIRVICDTNLKIPIESSIVRTAQEVPTIIATCCSNEKMHDPFLSAGCKIILVHQKNGMVDLNHLMEQLGADGIDSILLEGGGALNWSALESGIVSKVQTYISPKILGGADAKIPVSGIGVESPDVAFFLKNSISSQIGEDILIESEVKNNVYRNC